MSKTVIHFGAPSVTKKRVTFGQFLGAILQFSHNRYRSDTLPYGMMGHVDESRRFVCSLIEDDAFVHGDTPTDRVSLVTAAMADARIAAAVVDGEMLKRRIYGCTGLESHQIEFHAHDVLPLVELWPVTLIKAGYVIRDFSGALVSDEIAKRDAAEAAGNIDNGDVIARMITLGLRSAAAAPAVPAEPICAVTYPPVAPNTVAALAGVASAAHKDLDAEEDDGYFTYAARQLQHIVRAAILDGLIAEPSTDGTDGTDTADVDYPF